MKDLYLKFTGPEIKGESQDKDHANWIEVDSWNFSIKQPRSATASTAGGHTSERTEISEISFSKLMDLVSPLLYQHAAGGTTFEEVTIDMMRADGEGKRVKYMEIKLKHVLIASVNAGGSPNGFPVDDFGLKFAAIQWTYTQQKIGGNQGGVTQGAWSLTKNDKIYSA